jgi:hypothetical protein
MLHLRVLGLAAAPTFLAAIAAGSDWTNLGGNAARNGLATVVGPTAPTSAWSKHARSLADRVGADDAR